MMQHAADTNAGEIIDEMVRTIAARFSPEMVVLFGSYARGDAGPDSDVDLLVVTDVPETRRAMATAIDRALSGRRLPLDLLVRTPADVRERRHMVGSIVRYAFAEGRIVYRRPTGRVSEADGEPRATPNPVREWIDLAEQDYRMAERLLRDADRDFFRGVGFHAQQCAEKYLKALLVARETDFPKTHELDRLMKLLEDSGGVPDGMTIDLGRPLNQYGADVRYPDDLKPVTEQEAREALRIAARIRDMARVALAAN